MRNDIKRFAVAVLAACGLAVSAALAEPSSQAELGISDVTVAAFFRWLKSTAEHLDEKTRWYVVLRNAFPHLP